jgi:NodT family efflux transporter outer membrane factor (OMF) lipoprotein
MNNEQSKGLLLLTGACAMGLLAGCISGPDFPEPEPPQSDVFMAGNLPDSVWDATAAEVELQRFQSETDLPESWWELFQSDTLNRSVQIALKDSPTLAQSMARLRQAQEEYAGQSGGRRLPSVDAGLSIGQNQVNPEAMGFSEAPVPDPFTLYNASLSISYAFDLFGKNRRVLERLQAKVDQQQYELDGARQTLVAQVVLAFIRQAGISSQIGLLQEVVAVRKQQVDIAIKRHEAGGISARELEGQRLLLAQAKTALPELEKQRARTQRQLAVYLGREPTDAPGVVEGLDRLNLPKRLPMSFPSEVARQRPDIRAAEALWHQASAQVGVATANLYPQITLSASLSSQETEPADFLSSMNVWSIGAGLMQPIFHGGELRSRKRSAVAAYEEAAAVYRQTVLRGLQEVADTLDALEADARSLAAQTAVAGHAQTRYEIARKQLKAGGISEVMVLGDQIQSLQAAAEQVQAEADRFADTAALFHALGGGWWKTE